MRGLRLMMTGLVLAMIAIAGPAGCLAVAVGAGVGGAVLYAEGDLEAVVDASPPEVTAAAESALGEMNVVILGHTSSGLDGQLTARTSQDKKVTIKVKRQSEKTSTVSIRVGTFGDEPLSRDILDRIKKRLGEG